MLKLNLVQIGQGGRWSCGTGPCPIYSILLILDFATQFYFYCLEFFLREIFLRIQLRGVNYLL